VPSQDEVVLTRAQVREVDRRAIEDYGVPGVVLMENAGRNAAHLIRYWTPHNGPVAIVCGRGNNGGDGFVIARHLHNAGIRVELLPACEIMHLTGDAATNAGIVEKMGLPLRMFDTVERIAEERPTLRRAMVIVDALLGTGFSGKVRSPMDLAINAINEEARAGGTKVVAIDLPSGLDCDTGEPSNATVKANHTITFVARKAGFDAPGAAAYTGEVLVSDIGAPEMIIGEVLAAN